MQKRTAWVDVHAVPMYADVFNPLHCLPLIREINHSAIQCETCIGKFLTNPSLLICGRADNAHSRLDIAWLIAIPCVLLNDIWHALASLIHANHVLMQSFEINHRGHNQHPSNLLLSCWQCNHMARTVRMQVIGVSHEYDWNADYEHND